MTMKMFSRWYEFCFKVFVLLVVCFQPEHDIGRVPGSGLLSGIPRWEAVGIVILFIGATFILFHKLEKDRAERRRVAEELRFRGGGQY